MAKKRHEESIPEEILNEEPEEPEEPEIDDWQPPPDTMHREQAAELMEVTVAVVRQYENDGLLKPVAQNPHTRRKYYPSADAQSIADMRKQTGRKNVPHIMPQAVSQQLARIEATQTVQSSPAGMMTKTSYEGETLPQTAIVNQSTLIALQTKIIADKERSQTERDEMYLRKLDEKDERLEGLMELIMSSSKSQLVRINELENAHTNFFQMVEDLSSKKQERDLEYKKHEAYLAMRDEMFARVMKGLEMASPYLVAWMRGKMSTPIAPPPAPAGAPTAALTGKGSAPEAPTGPVEPEGQNPLRDFILDELNGREQKALDSALGKELSDRLAELISQNELDRKKCGGFVDAIGAEKHAGILEILGAQRLQKLQEAIAKPK